LLCACRDWKKLTFYYFADAYINFNSLVTDLFKIYKTRIWMSAINPASFVTPTAGLQPPGSVGPAGMSFGQEVPAERRRQHEFPGYGHGQPGPQAAADVGRDIGQARSPYADPYQAFGQAGRQPGLGLTGFAPGLQQQADPFSSYPSNYGGIMDSNVGEYGTQNQAGAGALRQTHPTHPTHGDWVNNFQGLSLNS
jgi:hypothetical protein